MDESNNVRGTRIYTLNGEIIIDPTIVHEGKDFFRKMTNHKGEIELCKLIMKYPHKNIINIYNTFTKYIDMELLNTDINNTDIGNITQIMTEVKTHLQNVGIMYIDWKLDNIGISEDGQFKLFDFDVSGLIDIETKKWIIKPPHYWSYNKAIENNMETPVDIDNYAFDTAFLSIIN
jgi:serine/threonine protein kinase